MYYHCILLYNIFYGFASSFLKKFIFELIFGISRINVLFFEQYTILKCKKNLHISHFSISEKRTFRAVLPERSAKLKKNIKNPPEKIKKHLTNKFFSAIMV